MVLLLNHIDKEMKVKIQVDDILDRFEALAVGKEHQQIFFFPARAENLFLQYIDLCSLAHTSLLHMLTSLTSMILVLTK